MSLDTLERSCAKQLQDMRSGESQVNELAAVEKETDE